MQHLQEGNSARKPRCCRSWKTRQGFRLRLPQREGKHPAQNSALRQVHTDTGHLKHRRDPRALTTDRLNHEHGRTLLLNYRKAPRLGGGGQKKGRAQRSERSRGCHEEDVRAEVRGNKDHVVFHDSCEELRLLQDISYDCSNHHQLYHQCREGDTGVSRRATKERWREEGRKGCGEGEEGNGGAGFNSYRRRVAGGRETAQRGTDKRGGHQGRRK
uniref:Uncharacterized protein n=1 Tax=Oryza barthii TaxID=65489 RepID=A0A0D3GF94_9ORYZ